jgi:hypothetical protein
MPTDQQRDDAYLKANPAQRYLYAHPSSGQALYAIAEKYDLTAAALYPQFAILVGDIVLGFYRSEDTARLLQQRLGQTAQMASVLANDINQFMKPLTDPTWKAPYDADADADAEAETLAAEIVTTDIALELADTEAELHTIPNVHTMSSAQATAADAEVTYSSTQSAILAEGIQNPQRQ